MPPVAMIHTSVSPAVRPGGGSNRIGGLVSPGSTNGSSGGPAVVCFG
jgi:hypothetical protein